MVLNSSILGSFKDENLWEFLERLEAVNISKLFGNLFWFSVACRYKNLAKKQKKDFELYHILITFQSEELKLETFIKKEE